MKSAGPKTSASSRGEAAAMASTSASPRGVLDLRLDADPPGRVAHRRLDLAEQQVQPADVVGAGDLGQHDDVQAGPGLLDHVDHVPVGPGGGDIVDPDGADPAAPRRRRRRAAATAIRAAAFWAGATASSRSRKTSSTGSSRALARNRGLLPGTARQVRRARAGRALTPGAYAAAPVSYDGGHVAQQHAPLLARRPRSSRSPRRSQASTTRRSTGPSPNSGWSRTFRSTRTGRYGSASG